MTNSTYSRISPFLLIGTGAVIFLANAGLLVLQLVAGRFLAPFIGSSIETWTCVIGVFLTGIALGNWLGGRIADRFPTPKTAAVLLFLGGLSALGMIACYELALKTGFYKSIPLDPRIPILAFLFCLLPAFMLSLLTPVTIKLLLPDVGSAGRIAGLIFALSTLGCLIGNYFSGFWLMAEFRLNEITAGVGIVLIALSVPIFLRMRAPNAGASLLPTASDASSDTSGPPDGSWDFKNNIRLAYAIVFLASFCGMSLELTGTRVLAPTLGVSLFTWTGIIGVMLAGTCCGNYLGGVLADRGVGPALRRFAFLVAVIAGAAGGPLVAREAFHLDPYARSWIEYGTRLLGAGAAVLCVFPGVWLSRRRSGSFLLAALLGGLVGIALAHTTGRAIDKVVSLPGFTDFHRSLSETFGFDVGQWLIHLIGFVVGVVITLLFAWDAPATNERITRSGALCVSLFAAGVMTLTILLLLLSIFPHFHMMTDEEDIVKKVLAWTFGAFFLPMLLLGTISPQVIRLSVADVKSAGRVAGSVYAWSTTGAIAGTFVTGYFMIASIGTFRVLMILAFLLTLLAFFVGRLWRNNAALYAGSIVVGGAIFGLFYVDYGGDRYDKETKYYAISVSLNRLDGPRRVRLNLDHLTHSIVDLDDPTWLHYEHEYVQGELLMLAKSRHEQTNLLVIGGGGYTFPRYVEHFLPEVSVEVVEIDPGVTEIAYEKLGLPRDTKIRTHNLDGRQFISERARNHHYHMVVQDAVNDYSVPAHLMTKEYNEAVKAALTPDGVYLLTFIDSLEWGRFWRTAVHTMRQSFPYVYVLSPLDFVEAVENEVGAKQIRILHEREVYIVYGSNQPLDPQALKRNVVTPFIERERQWREDIVSILSPLEDLAAKLMFLPLAGTTAESIAPWMLKSYTHVLDDKELDRLLNDPQYKKIILEDQYCPVDNLMMEVFRESLKKPKKKK